jgi:hypothetical protein
MKRVMNTATLLVLGLFAVATFARAQEVPKTPPVETTPQDKTDIKSHDKTTDMKSQGHTFDASRLGKATFSNTKNGINAQVWFVSRAEHDRVMGLSGDKPHEMDKSMSEDKSAEGKTTQDKTYNKDSEKSMTSAKPEVAIILLTDATTGAQINNATAQLDLSSPSKKTSTVTVTPMNGHYSGALDLSEKGSYKVALKITRDGKTTTMNFDTPFSAS